MEQGKKQYAGDRYQIVGHDNYRFILFDNKNKKEIRLCGKHVIQEILRPTPSAILPVDNRGKVNKNLTTWDAWYKLCLEYKEEFGHLCPSHKETYKDRSFGD